jgi:hypothetical protein
MTALDAGNEFGTEGAKCIADLLKGDLHTEKSKPLWGEGIPEKKEKKQSKFKPSFFLPLFKKETRLAGRHCSPDCCTQGKQIP